MRALALLLVVVVAILLVLKFYPSSEVEGAGPEEAPPPAEGSFEDQFLTGASSPQRPAARDSVGAAGPIAASRGEATPSNAPAPAKIPSVTPGRNPDARDAAEAPLGAALLHGTPDELTRLLDARGIEGGRRLCLSAFAEAMAGQRERAANLAARIDRTADLPEFELRALDVALGGEGAATGEGAGRPAGPVALAMRMALLQREARGLLEGGEYAAAARDLSELLLLETDAPWSSDRSLLAAWSRELSEAQRNHRWNPRGEWPSVTMEVEEGDHLTAIRKRYLARYPDRLMCTGLVERANRIHGFIHPGDKLRIPTDPVSVIVDLGSRWTLYLHGNEVVEAWEVGIGRPGEETITGTFQAGIKKENPMWTRIGQEAIPFGDPRNPLGTRWIGWNRDGRATSYGFHGTKDPESIGQAASDGCIRFRNKDVELLFEILPVGAPILVRN